MKPGRAESASTEVLCSPRPANTGLCTAAEHLLIHKPGLFLAALWNIILYAFVVQCCQQLTA